MGIAVADSPWDCQSYMCSLVNQSVSEHPLFFPMSVCFRQILYDSRIFWPARQFSRTVYSSKRMCLVLLVWTTQLFYFIHLVVAGTIYGRLVWRLFRSQPKQPHISQQIQVFLYPWLLLAFHAWLDKFQTRNKSSAMSKAIFVGLFLLKSYEAIKAVKVSFISLYFAKENQSTPKPFKIK